MADSATLPKIRISGASETKVLAVRRGDVSESSDRVPFRPLSSTPVGMVFNSVQSAIGTAISDEDVVTDDYSGDRRRVGWTPLDRAPAGTLEMQGNDGLALTQWPIQYFEAALWDRVNLVAPHRTSGESSLGCSCDHLALARVVGDENQRGPSGGFKGGGVTRVRVG